MLELARDFRLALRSLSKHPAFAIAAVLALALSIGANTAVFSVVHALLAIPVPIEDPERVAFVWSQNPEKEILQGPSSVDDFLDLRGQSSSFSSLSASLAGQVNVLGAGEPQRLPRSEVTPGFFATLGATPVRGRGFLESEGVPGQNRAVVVSHGFWQTSLGGDEDVLGSVLDLDGVRHTVVGIAPEGFFFGQPNTAFWTPLALEPGTATRDQRTLVVFGRLRDGVSIAAAAAEAGSVAERLASAHPDTNTGWTSNVISVPENFRQGSAFAAILLYSCITLVLLIACVNVANLLLARALARERELALRSSLGASRGRLVGQLLSESLALALTGGVLGMLVGLWGIRFLSNALAPDPNVGFLAQAITPGPAVVLHALGISALAGLLFGALPAMQVTRGPLASLLAESGRGGESRRRQKLRNALVTAEVALALALLVAAAAMLRAFDRIYTADPGLDPENVLTLQLALPEETYTEPGEVSRFFERALEGLGSLPAAESAAVTTMLPLTGFPGPGNAYAEVMGETREQHEQLPNVSALSVSDDYFRTLRIETLRGRTFDSRDRGGSAPVAVVSQSFVDRFHSGTDGLGESLRLRMGADDRVGSWIQVVGVVADHQNTAHSLRNPGQPPLVFLPAAQRPERGATLLVRSSGDPMALAQPAREAVWQVDARLPIVEVLSHQQAIARVDTQNTFFLYILSGLALISLVLAAVGIYGVIAYSVSQRTREIGIRTALGAPPSRTVSLVARQAATLTTLGLVIGCGLAFALVRFMANQLEGIGQTGAGGPATFGMVSAAFLGVALLASAWPAYRAVRVDPASTLRQE
ncbi:MAG: ABC transporter permease [Holophagales bacterium]|nr:ABC transporter permease [Holophagales bacterium]